MHERSKLVRKRREREMEERVNLVLDILVLFLCPRSRFLGICDNSEKKMTTIENEKKKKKKKMGKSF
jgi:hypothetical protein